MLALATTAQQAKIVLILMRMNILAEVPLQGKQDGRRLRPAAPDSASRCCAMLLAPSGQAED
jgi:hypothetical protein